MPVGVDAACRCTLRAVGEGKSVDAHSHSRHASSAGVVARARVRLYLLVVTSAAVDFQAHAHLAMPPHCAGQPPGACTLWQALPQPLQQRPRWWVLLPVHFSVSCRSAASSRRWSTLCTACTSLSLTVCCSTHGSTSSGCVGGTLCRRWWHGVIAIHLRCRISLPDSEYQFKLSLTCTTVDGDTGSMMVTLVA